MNNLLKEMHAFLDGRDNRLAAALSDLPTSQIDQFNQYLASRITASGQVLEAPDLLPPTADAPDATTHSTADAWTALSWTDPVAVKSQIDQHLSTIRTELQAFFGVFTESELSAAAAQLEGLSITTLIDGAKSNTHSLMDLLGAQQGAPSSLVDDVLASMGQVMDSHSLVTADAPMDGLLHGWQPPLAVASALLHPADHGMDMLGMGGLHAHDAASAATPHGSGASADAVLIDQLQSAVMSTPVDVPHVPHVPHISPAYGAAPEPMPLAEGLFSPLSTTASTDLILPGGHSHFGDHV